MFSSKVESEVIWFTLKLQKQQPKKKKKICLVLHRNRWLKIPHPCSFFFLLLEDWFECLGVLWYHAHWNAYYARFGWIWLLILSWKVLASVGLKQFLITTFVEICGISWELWSGKTLKIVLTISVLFLTHRLKVLAFLFAWSA